MASEQQIREAAKSQIQELAESELFVAGLVAYWAEGAKAKPWMSSPSVVFMNSDPGMVQLFLAWLQLLGIGPDRLSFRVSIHESAEVDAAVSFWAGVVEVQAEKFMRSTQAQQTHDDAEECRRHVPWVPVYTGEQEH